MDQPIQQTTPAPTMNTQPSLMKRTFTPKFILVLLGIIVLGSAAYGYVWWQGKQSAETVIPTYTPRTEDPTASWKTYTNTEYGFSFMYPEDWTVETLESNGKQAFGVKSVGGNYGITIIPQGEFDHDLPIDEPEKTIIQLGDAKASLWRWTNFESIKILDLKDNWTSDNRIEIIPGDKNTDQILSTFKFTNQVDTSNWKTYTNTEYGFSFKYPGEYENGATVDGFPDLNLGEGEITFVISSNLVSGNVVHHDYFGELNNPDIDEVGGSPAYKFKIPKYCEGYITFIPIPSKSIEISLDNCFVGHAIDKNFPNSRISLYNQILSTFKFTP